MDCNQSLDGRYRIGNKWAFPTGNPLSVNVALATNLHPRYSSESNCNYLQEVHGLGLLCAYGARCAGGGPLVMPFAWHGRLTCRLAVDRAMFVGRHDKLLVLLLGWQWGSGVAGKALLWLKGLGSLSGLH